VPNGTSNATLTSLQVNYDNGTSTTKNFTATAANGYPTNIKMVDLKLLSEAAYSLGDALQQYYWNKQSEGTLTTAQSVFYKQQLVAVDDNLKSLFASYLAVDNAGADAFVASRTFAQSVMYWLSSKLPDYDASATTDMVQINHLEQNIFAMYGDLVTSVKTYIASTAGTKTYTDLVALKQMLLDIGNDARFMLVQAQASNAPNYMALVSLASVML
jgi:predicted HAD superfamily hydrolase